MVSSAIQRFLLLGTIILFFQIHAEAQQVEVLMKSRTSGEQVYSPGNISGYRKDSRINVGKVRLYNGSNRSVSFQVYHSDDPGGPFSTTIINPQTNGVCSYTIGSDWGIRFIVDNEQSAIFFIGKVCKLEPMPGTPGQYEFVFYYNGTGQVANGQPKYDTVVIRSNENRRYVWMVKNLNVDRFQNGDLIPEAKSASEWKAYGEAGKAAWCYYNYDRNNGDTYGKLYNWYAVKDPRGLAPSGWGVPSDVTAVMLNTELGREQGHSGVKAKSRTGWYKDGNGTNSSGFTGLPGGYCDANGSFDGLGKSGKWWTSSQNFDITKASYFFLSYADGDLTCDKSEYREYGLSVRCTKIYYFSSKTNQWEIFGN